MAVWDAKMMGVLAAGALLLAAVGPAVRDMSARRQRVVDAALSDYEIQQRNRNAFAQILGEFRTSSADMMYIKTETYLHGGMRYVPHLDNTAMLAGDVKDAGGAVRPAVLNKDNDFRGILGDLERSVKPYTEKHRHFSTDELLPWYRLMTSADPHYVRGYRIGSMWLAKLPSKMDEAFSFVNEGLAQNQGHPEEYRLWVTKCQLWLKVREANRNNPDVVRQAVEEALACARKAKDLGVKERPPDGKLDTFGPHILWTDDADEDFMFGLRYVAILTRELGRREEALREAQEALRLVPNDRPLKAMVAKLSEPLDEP